jgi:hypothetical protein
MTAPVQTVKALRSDQDWAKTCQGIDASVDNIRYGSEGQIPESYVPYEITDEEEADYEARLDLVRKPLARLKRAREEFAAAAKDAFWAAHDATCAGNDDHFRDALYQVSEVLQEVKNLAEQKQKLLDDKLSDRCEPGRVYFFGVMPEETAGEFKAEFGRVFDILVEEARNDEGSNVLYRPKAKVKTTGVPK